MSGAASSGVVVVDTNVVSYLFKRDSRGDLYKPHLEGKLAMIAAQTFAELELLPLNNNWGGKRHAALRDYLKKYLFIEANEAVSALWAAIQSQARRAGRPMPVGDAWIAATALAYDAPLVTHNPGDFINVQGLTVITEK